MEIDEIYANQRKWRMRRDNAERRAETARRTIEGCYKHLGTHVMVTQIAEALAPYFPDYQLEVLGPFGLGNDTVIHANDPTIQGRGCKAVGSLAFRPYDAAGLRLIDRSRNTGEYSASSLGGINGFNYPDVELPDSIEGIAQLLRDSINEERP